VTRRASVLPEIVGRPGRLETPPGCVITCRVVMLCRNGCAAGVVRGMVRVVAHVASGWGRWDVASRPRMKIGIGHRRRGRLVTIVTKRSVRSRAARLWPLVKIYGQHRVGPALTRRVARPNSRGLAEVKAVPRQRHREMNTEGQNVASPVRRASYRRGCPVSQRSRPGQPQVDESFRPASKPQRKVAVARR